MRFAGPDESYMAPRVKSVTIFARPARNIWSHFDMPVSFIVQQQAVTTSARVLNVQGMLDCGASTPLIQLLQNFNLRDLQ